MLSIKATDVTVLTGDMDKAVSFYQKIGLIQKNRWGNHYAQMTTAGVTIGLHPGNENTAGSGNVSIGFMVDDIAEAKALLEEQQITHEVHEGKSGKFLHFKDSDGTVLYFMQPVY